MRNLLSLFLFVVLSSCASAPKPRSVPDLPQSEFLHYCGMTDYNAYDFSCGPNEIPTPITWDHLPLLVAYDAKNVAPLLSAIYTWNRWMGFEVFRITENVLESDVYMTVDGPNSEIRASTILFFDDAKVKQRALIIVYQDALGDVSTAAHELGHVIGLAHDPDNIGSIMYPRFSGRVLPGLEEQDRAALRKRYRPKGTK